jgi:hypothetical protein
MSRVDVRSAPATVQALNSGLESEQYVRAPQLAGWGRGSGATVGQPAITAGGVHSVVNLAATGGSVSTSFPRPTSWVNGMVTYSLQYTGSTSSTKPLGLAITLFISAVGETLAAATSSADVLSLPGPAVAETILEPSSISAMLPVTAAGAIVGASIVRSSGDSYTGVVRLVGFKFQFYPRG